MEEIMPPGAARAAQFRYNGCAPPEVSREHTMVLHLLNRLGKHGEDPDGRIRKD